jgi:hypothetical protein
MGIKQVANANDRYRYDELLYVRKTYFSPEALRNANGAVVNKLLACWPRRCPRREGGSHSRTRLGVGGRLVCRRGMAVQSRNADRMRLVSKPVG